MHIIHTSNIFYRYFAFFGLLYCIYSITDDILFLCLCIFLLAYFQYLCVLWYQNILFICAHYGTNFFTYLCISLVLPYFAYLCMFLVLTYFAYLCILWYQNTLHICEFFWYYVSANFWYQHILPLLYNLTHFTHSHFKTQERQLGCSRILGILYVLFISTSNTPLSTCLFRATLLFLPTLTDDRYSILNVHAFLYLHICAYFGTSIFCISWYQHILLNKMLFRFYDLQEIIIVYIDLLYSSIHRNLIFYKLLKYRQFNTNKKFKLNKTLDSTSLLIKPTTYYKIELHHHHHQLPFFKNRTPRTFQRNL